MLKHINNAIKILIYSDFFLNSAWGLLGPVFAIFLVQKIAIGSIAEGVKIAGFASLVYWTVKSALQIPIGKYLDKNHGEKDDFWFMIIGTLIAALIPLGYLISSLAWHIYLLQVIHGVAMAMFIPSWYAIFTRHIDKGKEAFEWSVDSTSLGFGIGITSAIGGLIASRYGFDVVFIMATTLNIVSVFLLFLIQEEISPKNAKSYRFPPIKPI